MARCACAPLCRFLPKGAGVEGGLEVCLLPTKPPSAIGIPTVLHCMYLRRALWRAGLRIWPCSVYSLSASATLRVTPTAFLAKSAIVCAALSLIRACDAAGHATDARDGSLRRVARSLLRRVGRRPAEGSCRFLCELLHQLLHLRLRVAVSARSSAREFLDFGGRHLPPAATQ